jgi:hypothetical protein
MAYNTYTDGCVLYACELNNDNAVDLESDKNIFKLVAINGNELAMSNWKTNNTQFSNIYGATFVCGSTVGVDYNGSISGCYNLVTTNYCDTFATAGCVWNGSAFCNITPTQYIGTISLNYGGGGSSALTCVCTGNVLCICANSAANNSGQVSLSGLRLYADCYHLVACVSACAGNNCGYSAIKFGNCTICCSTFLYPAQNAIFACACYDFVKIPGTDNCYCYSKNGVLQCCIGPVIMSTYSYNLTAQGGGGGSACSNSIQCILMHNPLIECYTTSLSCVRSCNIVFPTAQNYIILSNSHVAGNGVLCASLLCSDNTCLANIPFNCLTDVSAYNLTTYKISLYNCCVCANCVTTPLCLCSYALQGVSINS